mgnify:CR=1 FL=1
MKIAIFATESFIIDILIIEIFVVEAPGGIPGAFCKSTLSIYHSHLFLFFFARNYLIRKNSYPFVTA